MIGSDTLDDLNTFYFNKGHRTEVDTTDGTVIYQGFAEFRFTTSAAKWRIKRTTITGSAISIKWANGNDARNNIWDDRATLSYS